MNDVKEKTSEQLEDKPNGEAIKGIMGGIFSSMSAENLKKYNLSIILSSLLTLMGGILMLTLRKIGFYVYIAGTLVAVVGSMAIFGGIVGVSFAAFFTVVGLLFIILYAINLKHMVK